MTKNHASPAPALLPALLGLAFCIWTALGNEVNICVTTGCTLYADFTIAHISLWWFGAAAFTILSACAILGQCVPGMRLAALFLLGDVCLLILMACTAPCVSCLVAALLFALSYLFFRRGYAVLRKQESPRRSILLWVWLALFVINLGQVARSQVDVWPILDESGDAKLRMFFSPLCRYCTEGIDVLSGNVDVAFYPVAESEADIARISRMQSLLDDGASMAEAVSQSREAVFENFWQGWSPAVILLRFRLLSNKAHIFSQGSQGVPFFERKGLPPDIAARAAKKPGPDQLDLPVPQAPVAPAGTDYTMPPELQGAGQCGAGVPCP